MNRSPTTTGFLLATMMLSVTASTVIGGMTLNYDAQVVDVIDGNTVVVTNKLLRGGVQLPGKSEIKLDAVVAPRLDQPGGTRARAFLEDLVKGKVIRVVELVETGKSRGAWVFVGEEDRSVNAVLIEEGHAWLTEPQASFAASLGKPKELFGKMKDLHQKAKQQKIGIWASENPVPPWAWKKNDNDGNDPVDKTNAGARESVSQPQGQ